MNQDGSLTFEEAFGKPSGAQPEGLTFEEAFGRTPQPSLWERANTPLVPWPKIDEDTGIDTADGRPVSYADNKYAVVIANKVREIGESFTSPLGIGLMAAGPLGKGAQALGAIKTAKVLHGTASAAGIGLGAHGLARGVPELVQAEDGPHRLAAALDAALSTAMVAGGVAGVRGIKDIKANVKEHTKEAFDADAAETRRLMDEGKPADAADKSVEKIEYIDGETVTVEGGKAPTDTVTVTRTRKDGTQTKLTTTREAAEVSGLLPKKEPSIAPVEPVFPQEPAKVIDAVVDDGTVTASAADLAKAAEIEKTGVPTEDAPAAAVRIPELSEPPQPMRQRDYAAEMARRSPEEEAIAAAREIERKQPEPLIPDTQIKEPEVSPKPATVPASEKPVVSEQANTELAELDELILRRGQAQNKVKGVKFSKTDEARFRELVQKNRDSLFETVSPTSDPVVGKDINGFDVRQSNKGTYYTFEGGRVRTGPAFDEPPPAEPPRSSVAAKTAVAEPTTKSAQVSSKLVDEPKATEPAIYSDVGTAFGVYPNVDTVWKGQRGKEVKYVRTGEKDAKGRAIFAPEPQPKPAPAAEKPAAKEPWQMTKRQYVGSDTLTDEIAAAERRGTPFSRTQIVQARAARQVAISEHRADVQRAIRQGKPVPTEVLADYPDLAKPASTGRNPLAVKDEPTASPKTAANKTAAPKVDIPDGATAVRVTDTKGRQSVVKSSKSEPVKDVVSRVQKDMGSEVSGMEFGTMRGQEFVPMTTPADPLIAKLEGLYIPKSEPGKVYALPHPEAIKAIGIYTWNGAVDVAIGAVRAGRAIGHAIDLAIEHIRKTFKEAFDEAKVRANLESSIREREKNPDIGSREMRDAGVNVKAAQGRRPDISEGMVEGAKSAEKYEGASTSKMAAAVRGMTPDELARITPDNPLYTAALTQRAVLAERAGDGAAANALFAESAKAATTAGQQGAYFKFLLAHEPYVYVNRVGRKVMEAGYDPLTAAKKIALKEHVEKAQAAIAELEKATDAYKMDESAANGDALLKAHEAAAQAERDLLNKTSAMLPNSVWSTLKTILQGNLLAPISQVANPVGNVIFTPFRALARGGSTVVDYFDSMRPLRDANGNPLKDAAGNVLYPPRQITTVSPSTAAKNLVGSLGKSWSETGDIMRHGAGDVVKNEHGRGIHPVLAWRDKAALAAEMPTINGKLSAGQIADVWLQRTFGMTAEPMLRLLAAADRFATNPAFMNAVDRQAALRTINGKAAPLTAEQLKVAHTMPELFFKPDVVKIIRDEALRATFQQESPVIRMLNGAIHKQGPFAEFMFATVAPYKLTPWNIIGEIFSYNPIVATANMGRHASLASSLGKKAARSKAIGETELARKQQSLADMNRREAKIAAGKLFVGGLLSASAWYLYKKGILSPSYDASDEATKTRIQAGDILAPNHMNISALWRLKMFGGNGDTMPRKGDTTVDVFRAGGLAGAFFYMAANLGRDMERSKDANSDEIAKNVAKSMTVEMMRYGINQSFLKGVAGILESAKEGRLDTVTQNWISAVVSIPLPNTLAAVSRATRDYKPDTKPEKFMDNFTNAVANRIGGVSRLANKALGTPIADAYMPLKRDVWGRPMEETPAGRSAFWYHFADVFKFQQASDSPLDMEVYRLARKTGSTEAIPSIPMPEFKFGRDTFKLDREHYAQFVELIGQNRRRMAEMIVTNPNFHTLPDAIKLRMLQRMYDAGEKIGKAQFLRRVGNPRQTFTKASARAGFVPE